ncbi:MAG: saccharopine dehydrogenase NADP-binding domain-containing protein [Gammaproteobacteria bacterium]|nr:saccharopine dehydrogenase NADP-binding domain-containing protein [Gammaproteobacteria bacterium]MDH5511875.1 saccharopine dehydrogenase NADP-binding domain-containing protein [Gammaproteobacteria bacterium]
MGKRILVLGANGTLGRRISRAIAAMPSAECVIDGRGLRTARIPAETNTTEVTVNIRDPASLRQALDGVFAVINAVGMFPAHDYTVAETCAGLGIHYVDLADSRAHVEGITRLNRRALQKNCQIVSGAGAVPAVSAALIDMLITEFDRISEIHVSFSPGNVLPDGEATLRTILGNAGNSFRLKENGRWRYAYGWSESVKVVYPEPLGRQRLYLSDVPDLDLFPARYGAQTVTFRAGLGLKFFNRGLFLLARMRRWGWIKNLPGWAPGLITAGRLFRGIGTAAGGMRVLVRGRRDGEELEHTVFLVARDGNGLAISCSPSLALIRRWVNRGVPDFGAVPCVGLLSWDEIKAEMTDHDIVLVRQ